MKSTCQFCSAGKGRSTGKQAHISAFGLIIRQEQTLDSYSSKLQTTSWLTPLWTSANHWTFLGGCFLTCLMGLLWEIHEAAWILNSGIMLYTCSGHCIATHVPMVSVSDWLSIKLDTNWHLWPQRQRIFPFPLCQFCRMCLWVIYFHFAIYLTS